MKQYYVYIMANERNTVLYTGVTSNLVKRAYEHKNKLIKGFSEKYNITKLVYYDITNDVDSAICREKQIKGWTRRKKIELIESMNPARKDLDPSAPPQDDTTHVILREERPKNPVQAPDGTSHVILREERPKNPDNSLDPTLTLAVQDDADVGKRLDQFLAKHLPKSTRSQIKKWIESGNVKIGSEIKKTSYKVKPCDEIDIKIESPKELSAVPQNIPLSIIYEDSDIVVVNKSADMVVHPAYGNPDGTLVNALLHHCKDLSGIGGVLRPGIVHRLDRGTSGVIVVAKNDSAHTSLAGQFKERITEKIYNAIIYGVPKSKIGTFEQKIGRHPTDRKKMSTKTRRGRESVTRWEVIENFGKHLSLVKIRLVTGRTHQIRVHFAAAGMPLLGDMLYGGKKTIKRLPEGEYKEVAEKAERAMLHAASISFDHPKNDKRVKFEARLPEDFTKILEELRAISKRHL